MAAEIQSSARPPAQPSYIFRGHAAQIHSVQILRQNTRLITGDADGWVVIWSLESRRPVAVWKAHDAAILGTSEWGSDRLLTHGRDTALRIWQLRSSDETNLSTILPTDDSTVHRPKPWLLHTLPVNTLNFCSFSMCYESIVNVHNGPSNSQEKSSTSLGSSILIAVPATDDKKIDVYQFPEEKLAYVISRVQTIDTGMVMAVKLVQHRSNNTLVIAGYEGGYTAVHVLSPRSQALSNSIPRMAQLVYLSRPHTQPILSLDISAENDTYFTSSADAIIANHRVPSEVPSISERDATSASQGDENSLNVTDLGNAYGELSEVSTDHGSGPQPPSFARDIVSINQQEPLSNADQPRITDTSLTADEGVHHIESAAGLNEEAPSSTPISDEPEPTEGTVGTAPEEHSPLSFPKKEVSKPPQSAAPSSAPSGLASLLSAAPEQPKTRPKLPSFGNIEVQPPYKLVNTKHAGQQSLQVRSDGRLFVTGGWDSRIRIYSTKTLKEVAVLKWHNDGVYATAFGQIWGPASRNLADSTRASPGASGDEQALARPTETKMSGLNKFRQQREERVQNKHWVVAGAKDGKVSLWEVF